MGLKFKDIAYVTNNHAFSEGLFDKVHCEAKKVGHLIPPTNLKPKETFRVVSFKGFEFNKSIWEIKDIKGRLTDKDYEETTKKYSFSPPKNYEEIS